MIVFYLGEVKAVKELLEFNNVKLERIPFYDTMSFAIV